MAQELLIAAGAGVAAAVAFVVGDWLRPNSWRQAGDESAGALALDLAKTFFTAVVAFVFVVCWQQHQSAHQHTVTEAKGLVEVYRAAEDLPAPDRQHVQDLVRSYTDQVLTEEWPSMEQQNRLSDSTGETLEALRNAVTSVQATVPAAADARSRALDGLDQATQARHDRALDMEGVIPHFLYVTMWLGAILVVLNPVLTGVQVTRRSVAMTALLGVVIGSTLLAIHNLERPYTGVIDISKDAFVHARSQFQDSTGPSGAVGE
ncbi:DUF4239 domain-containing protein [Nocardia transvalensis]|uniref:bestrophin-like domain n=1 Tax=Nocardia transvalensis TaxID=37333 RepID=UPI001894EFF7|nr:DUF4239 domain-containing protein [Nocardia transvalensis]MBF6327748.1 DUF4239 domain-containing protein [Nocardia transvalensis]